MIIIDECAGDEGVGEIFDGLRSVFIFYTQELIDIQFVFKDLLLCPNFPSKCPQFEHTMVVINQCIFCAIFVLLYVFQLYKVILLHIVQRIQHFLYLHGFSNIFKFHTNHLLKGLFKGIYVKHCNKVWRLVLLSRDCDDPLRIISHGQWHYRVLGSLGSNL